MRSKLDPRSPDDTTSPRSVALSRRSFLKGVACAAGAAVGTRLVGSGSGWEGSARAESERPALLVVYLEGGYNALFGSADGLTGSFGVDAGNVEDLGNGLVVDAATFGALPDVAKQKMATIGVVHGLTDHDPGQMEKWWTSGSRSYLLQLADVLGGDGAIKAAIVGDGQIPGASPAEGGVTLQTVRDMEATIAALGASAADPKNPARDITAAALARAAEMSKGSVDSNPTSLLSLKEAYPTASAVLKKPLKTFSFPELSNAYGLDGATTVDGFSSRIAAAELMITAGANVVVAIDGDWDSHGDVDGSLVRNKMSEQILPSLNTFIDRMFNDAERNVVVAIFGDFARSLPGSDHQPNCAVSVMGKYVKTGTTGRVDRTVNMPSGTPDIPQMWAYLAAVLKAPTNPFGNNPHALVL
jgi:hypothetical protein